MPQLSTSPTVSRAVIAAIAAVTAIAAVPAAAPLRTAEVETSTGSLDGLPHVESGALPGPDILYADAPYAPQLENTGIWQAEPLLVSGATAYVDGEWLYQDWLFDDHGARGTPDRNSPYGISHHLYSPAAGTFTYPTAEAYVHNAADLVELRAKLVGDELAFRVTLNSMVDPGLSAFTIALDTGTGSTSEWPFGAGTSSPADLFVTVAGDDVALTAAGAPPVAAFDEGAATVDLLRRQVEVRVPLATLEDGAPLTTLGVTIGTGLWDAAAGSYLAPAPGLATETTPGGGSALGTAIVNVGPRRNDQEPTPFVSGATMGDTAAGAAVLAAWWREQAQAQALTVGDVSQFHATLDLDVMRQGVTDRSGVPTSGPINRILASHTTFGQGIDLDRVCFGISAGIDVHTACEGRWVGQLQPYTVHVPDGEAPEGGWGTTLLLHALSANQNQYTGTNNALQLMERGSGHLVITPGGRGPDGFYKGFAEADTFETWADVARHYPLDGGRVAVSGYSMGSYGTYRLLARYPDLFAAGFNVVGQPGTSADQLASLRNHRVMSWNAAADELVQVHIAERTHEDLLLAGVQHTYWLFPGADHLTLAGNDEYTPGAEFLGEAVVDRAPRRVDYVVDPTDDNVAAGMVADHAYWLSGLTVAEGATKGSIVAIVGSEQRSLDVRDPMPGVLPGGFQQAMPFIDRGLDVSVTSTPADVLTLEVTDLATVIVDVERAGITCDAEVVLTSNTTTEVVLDGCDDA